MPGRVGAEASEQPAPPCSEVRRTRPALRSPASTQLGQDWASWSSSVAFTSAGWSLSRPSRQPLAVWEAVQPQPAADKITVWTPCSPSPSTPCGSTLGRESSDGHGCGHWLWEHVAGETGTAETRWAPGLPASLWTSEETGPAFIWPNSSPWRGWGTPSQPPHQLKPWQLLQRPVLGTRGCTGAGAWSLSLPPSSRTRSANRAPGQGRHR